jgi:hypothetical protein
MLPVQPMPMDPTPQHAARCSNVLHKCASQLRYGWLCECASYLLECGTVALVWYRGSVVRCARSAQGKFWVDICKIKKGGYPNQVNVFYSASVTHAVTAYSCRDRQVGLIQ